MIYALAGNQNSGKTTLFNQLTGSNQHVGNFPGVTVERKDGMVRNHRDMVVVDLPGIYSLSPYTAEEIVTRDFLLGQSPDGIINIVDATNLERNLYLTLQLIELGLPMVIALNMMDEVRSSGTFIEIKKLESELGVPIVPISASKNEGVDELIEKALISSKNNLRPIRVDFCTGPVHRAIHSVVHMIEDHAQSIGVPPRFAATKLLEGDEPMTKALKLSDNEVELVAHTVTEMEYELGMDREAALADMRYAFIEDLCKEAVIKQGESEAHTRSVTIDRVLTSKYFGIPIFFAIMFLVFWLTFGVIGSTLSDLLSSGIDVLTVHTDALLTLAHVNPVIHSLLIDGVFAGVGSVLSFLPIIITLFFFLSLLEDSGYMARVAFVMDKLLRKIGLSGRSFVPMLIGFGCTVPAIMATRTLASERDRKMTILLTPFMSCSAKLPVYAVFSAAFFSHHAALVMIGLYILGILLAILTGIVLKSTLFRGNPVPFVMELPNYRMPSPVSVALLLWSKAKDFLTRAFTIIFLATLAVWFLQTFDFRLNVAASAENSILSAIGTLLSPLFAPLGFDHWMASTALLTGFSAKEAVISTFAVLTGSSGDLVSSLTGIFTPLSALSFLVFTLLYTPCIAAVTAVSREMKSKLYAFTVVLFQTGIAWVISFVFFSAGRMMGF